MAFSSVAEAPMWLGKPQILFHREVPQPPSYTYIFKHEIKLSNTPKGHVLGGKLTSCKSAPRTSSSVVALRDTYLFHHTGRGPVLDMKQV